jgi:hypothetical protein
MKMQQNSLAMKLLLQLDSAADIASTAFALQSEAMRWSPLGRYPNYKSAVYRLIKAQLIEAFTDKKNKGRKLLKLTPKGEIQILIAKSRFPQPQKWDGKWRVVFFDIPEDNKVERQQLRRLLLKNGFKKLQASVYICPWPLHREAIGYLKKTGLIGFIRFGRLDDLDDDSDIKKLFSLK